MSADRTIQDVFNRFYPEYTKTHDPKGGES